MKIEECELHEVTLETGKKVQIYVPVGFSEIGMQDYYARIFGRSKWHKSEIVEVK